MYPSTDERYSPLRVLGKLESDHRGECFVGNADLSELILAHFKEGQDLDITIKPRHTEGWGE